jgi:hypothetical protein
MMERVKPVIWIESSRRDLRSMPPEVRRNIGQGLYTAQQGMTDPAAKPLKGFVGTRVMEIVERLPTAPFTPLTFPSRSMSCMYSKRSPSAAADSQRARGDVGRCAVVWHAQTSNALVVERSSGSLPKTSGPPRPRRERAGISRQN